VVWPILKLDANDLETRIIATDGGGKRPGLIGVIFRKAQDKIQDPANSIGPLNISGGLLVHLGQFTRDYAPLLA
jgi:hypothetical protein